MNTESKTAPAAIFYITKNGCELAGRVADLFPAAEVIKFNSALFAKKWAETGKIICIMATGIAVRAMSSLLEDKKTDPAVVLLDEKGDFVISLLSGHIGGANALAKKIADGIGARPVITTASDVQGKVALDMWAEAMGLYVEDFELLKKMSARIVNNKDIKVKVEGLSNNIKLPAGLVRVKTVREADMIISHRINKKDVLYLRPKVLCTGIGCNRGTTEKEIADVIGSVFERVGLSMRSISTLASIDLKKDEKGLVAFARDNGLEIEFYGKDELNRTAEEHNIKGSAAVQATTGAVAVAEPAALLSAKRISGKVSVIIPKEKRGNVTLAIALAELAL
ncbi:MAG TPA: cobalamin biosynthesis protein CbiG [Nitrospirae bacterium]|nr:cobalamin biosynthesis protein CbiG [Nitrospirota bacterium]